ncbi:hypothetical protein H4219_004711 [Mycoemilia scoparia]|uniref:aspartyl aminopeptidase n=1 Tax=Mycoemilia scoparia TaxID=417184 RepID=A0A9W8DQW6_9FUNG|nr:hypothetical protein H4219_004711 [Mycoemilia scoparia]
MFFDNTDSSNIDSFLSFYHWLAAPFSSSPVFTLVAAFILALLGFRLSKFLSKGKHSLPNKQVLTTTAKSTIYNPFILINMSSTAAAAASYPAKEYLATQAKNLVSFINSSPSPFHAVDTVRTALHNSSFTKLSERENWDGKIRPNGRYYFTRNGSSIVAFTVGGKFKPGNGVHIVAAHTDSPCLKLKPISKKTAQGYLQVGVQTYGGGVWHSWFDRDLSVAGRVMVKKTCLEGGEGWEHKLVRIDEPILRIPTLAIHLDRSVNEEFKFNKETHLLPVLATVEKTLNGGSGSGDVKGKEFNNGIEPAHHPILIERLGQELGTTKKAAAGEIGDFELCLYDTQPSTIGGISNEFVFSPRLDNLCMSYCAVEGLLESLSDGGKSLESEEGIRMVALFDNEEIGSQSAYGADSALLEATLRRLQTGGHQTAFEESVTKSYLVSADMAHAVHPNYPEKHEENHRPKLHKGTVIKINANQRYATTAATSMVLKMVASQHGIPLQEFVVRNDSPCGSTIGPILSSKLGLRTIGNIRETCGSDDVGHAVTLFKHFFEQFTDIDARINVD